MSENKPEQKSDEDLLTEAVKNAFAAFDEHCKAEDYYCGVYYYCGVCGWQSLDDPCVHHPRK